MFSDPQFWVAIAFIIFVLAIFQPVRKILSSSLDSKINEIKNSIDEAENLKNDTLINLNNIKKRQNEIEIEIGKIHTQANKKIKIIEQQAHKRLKDQIKKKELLAQSKIDQMIRDTNLSIQKNISQTAIEATINIIERKLNQNDKQTLIDQSVDDLTVALKN